MINISSTFGTSGGFGTSPDYHEARSAVRTLTKNTALHWADRGVRLNSVHPRFIDTPFLDQAKGTPVEQAMLDVTPMDAWASPPRSRQESPTWLGDDASCITGLELYIDGGYTAR